MAYKWCVVPQCFNTTVLSPQKLFVTVPSHPERRKLWLQLARRDPNSISVQSAVFMCEDHFDMEKDVINYMKCKMGFSQRILLTDEAVPSKFSCQENCKRRLPNAKSSRKVGRKKQRMDVTESLQSQTSQIEDEHLAQKIIEPKDTCIACSNTFTGFVYECVQCEYRMCCECDAAGEHAHHYMLRVPYHRPKAEMVVVLNKVREAINTVPFDEISDENMECAVVVKIEVENEEADPLSQPLEIEIKQEKPDIPEIPLENPAAVYLPGGMRGDLIDTRLGFKNMIKYEPPDASTSTALPAFAATTHRTPALPRPHFALVPNIQAQRKTDKRPNVEIVDNIPKRGRPRKKAPYEK